MGTTLDNVIVKPAVVGLKPTPVDCVAGAGRE